MKLSSREVVSGLEGMSKQALLKACGLTDADLEARHRKADPR